MSTHVKFKYGNGQPRRLATVQPRKSPRKSYGAHAERRDAPILTLGHYPYWKGKKLADVRA